MLFYGLFSVLKNPVPLSDTTIAQVNDCSVAVFFRTNAVSDAVPFDDITRQGMIGSEYHSLNTMQLSVALSYLPPSEYKRVADAIAALSKSSGKPPMLLSLCQWGRVSVNH